MQNRPTTANVLTAEQWQQLEADHTFKRVVELELEPVRGNFDVAHLNQISLQDAACRIGLF